MRHYRCTNTALGRSYVKHVFDISTHTHTHTSGMIGLFRQTLCGCEKNKREWRKGEGSGGTERGGDEK